MDLEKFLEDVRFVDLIIFQYYSDHSYTAHEIVIGLIICLHKYHFYVVQKWSVSTDGVWLRSSSCSSESRHSRIHRVGEIGYSRTGRRGE